EEVAGIITRMMAHDPVRRFQTPHEVAEALEPWTNTPISPPTDEELPVLSPAARGAEGEMPMTPPPSRKRGLRSRLWLAIGGVLLGLLGAIVAWLTLVGNP